MVKNYKKIRWLIFCLVVLLFSDWKSLSVILSLDKRDYPENLQIVCLCHNKEAVFWIFHVFDLVFKMLAVIHVSHFLISHGVFLTKRGVFASFLSAGWPLYFGGSNHFVWRSIYSKDEDRIRIVTAVTGVLSQLLLICHSFYWCTVTGVLSQLSLVTAVTGILSLL